MPHLMTIQDLSCQLGGNLVVNDLSLTVATEETVCLLGPSGCGKSTTLRLIAGLERAHTGRILIDDVVVEQAGQTSVAPEHRGLGYLFQEYALFPHLTLEQNVAFGLAALAASERRIRVNALIERIGLAHLKNAYPNSLSGGEQQRVALARALAARPKLMLMDEPFSSLDPQLRSDMRVMIKSMLSEGAMGSVIVTHDADDAMALADRIAVMIDGKIVQSGTPQSLYYQPLNRTIAHIFGGFNELSLDEASQLFPEIPSRAPASARSMAVRFADILPNPMAGSAPEHSAHPKDLLNFSADVAILRQMGSYAQCTLALPSGQTWRMDWYGIPPQTGRHELMIPVDRVVFFDDN